jgi:hypothetical protein
MSQQCQTFDRIDSQLDTQPTFNFGLLASRGHVRQASSSRAEGLSFNQWQRDEALRAYSTPPFHWLEISSFDIVAAERTATDKMFGCTTSCGPVVVRLRVTGLTTLNIRWPNKKWLCQIGDEDEARN